jgi:hypothetical protein
MCPSHQEAKGDFSSDARCARIRAGCTALVQMNSRLSVFRTAHGADFARVTAVRFHAGNEHARGHVNRFQHFARSRVHVPQLALLAFLGATPELMPSQVTPVTKRLACARGIANLRSPFRPPRVSRGHPRSPTGQVDARYPAGSKQAQAMDQVTLADTIPRIISADSRR